MSAERYDVVVIGGGPGGYAAAIRLAQLGLRAAVVERESMGGVCLNWGCIPSKALITAAKQWESLREGGVRGIAVGSAELDFARTQGWKDGIVGPEASELVAGAAFAVEMMAAPEDVGLTIHTHPTLSEALHEAMKHAAGEALHTINRRRSRATGRRGTDTINERV